MNNPELKNQLSKNIDVLRSHLKQVEKITGEIDSIKSDSARIQERRQKCERHRDDKSVLDQIVLERQAAACSSDAVAHAGQLTEKLQNLHNILQPMKPQAVRLLRAVYDQRVNTIAATLRPFSGSEASAKTAAMQTDSCRMAWAALEMLSTPRIREHAPRIARRIIAIFEEAVKDDGDLLQFLTPPAKQGKAEKSVEAASA